MILNSYEKEAAQKRSGKKIERTDMLEKTLKSIGALAAISIVRRNYPSMLK